MNMFKREEVRELLNTYDSELAIATAKNEDSDRIALLKMHVSMLRYRLQHNYALKVHKVATTADGSTVIRYGFKSVALVGKGKDQPSIDTPFPTPDDADKVFARHALGQAGKGEQVDKFM